MSHLPTISHLGAFSLESVCKDAKTLGHREFVAAWLATPGHYRYDLAARITHAATKET